jgi:hypothetical protein
MTWDDAYKAARIWGCSPDTAMFLAGLVNQLRTTNRLHAAEVETSIALGARIEELTAIMQRIADGMYQGSMSRVDVLAALSEAGIVPEEPC